MDDYRAVQAATMAEKTLQELVRRLSIALGYRFYHPFDSRRSAPGYFDCTLMRAPRLIFAELKTETGRLTTHQVAWREEALLVPGAEYYLWRPSDWLSGEIERVLR